MSGMADRPLPAGLLRRLLERLGVEGRLRPDFSGLCEIYDAWCQNVPFDSVLKRVHIASEATGPLPVMEAEDFFENYLRHGTGGTCWPISNALYALLAALGFDVRRIAGAMLDFPQIPAPNHGTVCGRIGGQDFLVDPFILSELPLPLKPNQETSVARNPNTATRASPYSAEGAPERPAWTVWWRFPSGKDWLRFGSDPRFDNIDHAYVRARYEQTGGTNSAFNQSVYLSRLVGSTLYGIYRNTFSERSANDIITIRALRDRAERDAALISIFGLSKEIVARLPEDETH